MTGPRAAIAMFTALPVPRRWHDDATPAHAPAALRWLPVIGAALGALAGLVASAVLWRDRSLELLAAAAALGALALLTRALHLDGLADTADGLGSRADAPRALDIMRRSDIGPFGVVTLGTVLLLDIGALTALPRHGVWAPLAGLAAAAATGRLAAVQAALPRVRAARPDGFGALVAGGISYVMAGLLSLLVLALGAGLAASVHACVVGWVVGQAGALIVAGLLCRHVARRLGGVTGDVFGTLVEVTTMLTLVAFALAG